MTTGTHPEPDAIRVRRWAAEQLDLPSAASASDARRAFMDRLRDEDFMPPLSWQQAHRALAGKTSPAVAAQVQSEEQERLREEVETFAVGFFRLEADARKKRWQELRQQCAFSPPLTARLRVLEPGLSLGVGPLPDGERLPYLRGSPELADEVRRLVEDLRALFVLRPHDRAVRRQELLREFASGARPGMKEAARLLSERYPQLAELERDLVNQLTTWEARVRKRVVQRKLRERAAAPASGASGNGDWRSYWWVVVIIIAALRALTSGSGPSRKYEPPPSFVPPTFPHFDAKKWEEINKPKFKPLPLDKDFWPPGTGGPKGGLFDDEFKSLDPEVKKLLEKYKKDLEQGKKGPFIPDTRPFPPPPFPTPP